MQCTVQYNFTLHFCSPLSVTDLAQHHSGEYTCTISSAFGVTRWSTRVNVRRFDVSSSVSDLSTGTGTSPSSRSVEELVGVMVPSRPDVSLLPAGGGEHAVALRWNISVRAGGKIAVMVADQDSLYQRDIELDGFLVEFFSPDWAISSADPAAGTGSGGSVATGEGAGTIGWRRVPHLLEYVDGGWPVRGCLEPGLRYYFVVRGRNRFGYGPPSPIAGPITIPPIELPVGPNSGIGRDQPANPPRDRDSQRPSPSSSNDGGRRPGPVVAPNAATAAPPFPGNGINMGRSTQFPRRTSTRAPAPGGAGGANVQADRGSPVHWVLPALIGLVAAIVILCFTILGFFVLRTRICSHRGAFSKSRESRTFPHTSTSTSTSTTAARSSSHSSHSPDIIHNT